MKIKRAPLIATCRSQRGTMTIMILIFSVPIVFMFYIGFILQPGLALVKNRMSQHQADYAALSLAYECAQDDVCRQSALDNPDSASNDETSIHLPDWPASLAKSVLQVLTLSNSAYAEDSDSPTIPPISGGTVSSDDQGRIRARIEGSDESRIGRTDLNFRYASEALVEFADGTGVEPVNLDDIGGIFRGFTGCEKAQIGGNSRIRGYVLTSENSTGVGLGGNSAIEKNPDQNGYGGVITYDAFTFTGRSSELKGDLIFYGVKSDGDSEVDREQFSGNQGIFSDHSQSGSGQMDGDIYIKGNFRTSIQDPQSGSVLKIPESLFVQGDFRIRQNINDVSGDLVVGGNLTVADGIVTAIVADARKHGGLCEDNDEEDAQVCDGAKKMVPNPDLNTTNPEEVAWDPDYLAVFNNTDTYADPCADPDPLFSNTGPDEDAPNSIEEFFQSYEDIPSFGDWTFSGDGRLTTSGVTGSDDAPRINNGYLKVDDFTLQGELTVRSGDDVTLHVTGDFKTAGNNARLDVEPRATLTLMVEGKLQFNTGELSASSVLTTDADGNTIPQLLILSIGDEVRLAGNATLRGLVYAPKGEVLIRGSQSVSGAVFAKQLDINGTPGGNDFIIIAHEAGLANLDNIKDLGGAIGGSLKPFIVK
ncbi:DUF7305 domain-containing protein [Halochromatium salexigens]|uniref:DUF7305 domain-containing protein n=1 Tax=Halochromatium salexigens TaxID=49447 RepID=UPI001914091D|nr:hypothetical protein [Halochromatium salexigens]